MGKLKIAVGERISKLRNIRGWSQEELANKADMNRSYIGQIERGERSVTVDVLERIAGAFDITVEELFRHLQLPKEQRDNTVLSSILELLNGTSIENQKVILDVIHCLEKWNPLT
ncbi:helix-turn-helix domain-containing protein [Caproicibacter sp. BJN0012]|uniref:helix-turn-helix domain-containing protein n=1 Tax=Caproicibacter sp. BJN0012 TaxID=3110227 RepID=UPI002E0D619C